VRVDIVAVSAMLCNQQRWHGCGKQRASAGKSEPRHVLVTGARLERDLGPCRWRRVARCSGYPPEGKAALAARTGAAIADLFQLPARRCAASWDSSTACMRWSPILA
jgi:hypothetical protein